MHATAELHADWEFVDWIDLQPGVGSFVSPKWDDFEVHGETVRALNWLHAEHQWLKLVLGRTAERQGREDYEWCSCSHCNHHIRYAVIFRNGSGDHYMVGQDCAQFINSKLDRKEWLKKAKLSEVKKVETKNGTRFVLKLDVPPWYWDLDRSLRPRFCSLSKYERPGRHGKETVWSLTIWGECPDEVLANHDALKKLAPR